MIIYQQEQPEYRFNFPATKFSVHHKPDPGGHQKQWGHLRSEAIEFLESGESMTISGLKEAFDFVHSFETFLRMCDPEITNLYYREVIGKNAERGYYIIETSEDVTAYDSQRKRQEHKTQTSGAETLKVRASAAEYLDEARQTLTERGEQYDSEEGERSAKKAAKVWETITGKSMTEAEAWLFLQVLKDVRQWQKVGHRDSALDCVAYAALKAEALGRKGD